MSEAYYGCPHCKGKIRIVMNERGQLLILKHEEILKELFDCVD